MRLIINADDLGLSRAVNYGILDAFHLGMVRSTTIMANMPAFSHGVALAQGNPALGVGIHLVLTAGKAVGGRYKTITDEEGNFLGQLEFIEKSEETIDPDEVEREYEAQIQKVLDAGIIPTHLDSHHHMHQLSGILPVFLKLARKYKLPVRISDKNLIPEPFQDIRTTDYFSDKFYGEMTTAGVLKSYLNSFINTDVVVELMSHPAYVDQELIRSSSYYLQRSRELEVINSSEMAEYIRVNRIELVNFRNLG